MTNTIVSIIVPCYNQGKYIAETLDSVKKQSYMNWECIIMDDGSTDNSKEVALSYCNEDKRFQYFYQENQGLAMTRNNGIKKSQGKYILPLDADDCIHQDYVTLAVSILEERENVKIVYSKAELFGAKTGEWILPSYSQEKMLIQNCIFCTAMFRRDDYNQTLGYNPNMKYGWEDWDFWLSLLETGGDVYHIPLVLFYYRKKEQSMIVDLSSNPEKIQILKTIIVKNHPLQYYQNYFNLYTQLEEIRNSRLYIMFELLRKVKRAICKQNH